MYCKNCGKKNPENYKFCEYCGTELSSEVIELEDVNQCNNSGKKTKKKIILLIIAGIVLVFLAMSAIMLYFDHENDTQYDDTVKKADKYMEKEEYKKAENTYLKAIDMKPEKAHPYINLADIYLIDERYEDANEILIKGQNNAGGEKINQKLEEIEPYILYKDYVDNVIIPDEGMVQTDKEISYASMRPGLISAIIDDFDKDGNPDLLTVNYGNKTATVLSFKLYNVDSGVVELAGEHTCEYRDGVDYINADASRFDVFLKKFENKYFLVVSGEILKNEYDKWSGYGSIEIFRLADMIEQVSVAEWELEPVNVSYSVNDNEVAYYSSYTSVEHEQDIYDSEINIGVKAVTDEMALFGFEKDRVSSACNGLFDMYIKCDEDEDEIHLCYIRHGVYNEDGSVNLTDAGITRYILDYTDIHYQN